MQILVLLVMYFDAVVVFVTSQTLLFRLAVLSDRSIIINQQLLGYVEVDQGHVSGSDCLLLHHRLSFRI